MNFEELLARRGFLLVDGAMGTELFARGLQPGDAPERMNLHNIKPVEEVHQAYVDAGSDIFLTNTFGANRFRLALHDLDGQTLEVNQAAAECASRVASAADRDVLVAGSIGPTGELLQPLGNLEYECAISAFAQQATGLHKGGADLIWIETMSSLEEAEAAVLGARESCDLPIAVTMSFDTAAHTMMGVSGTAAAKRLNELQVDAMGANCGNNLTQTEAALAEMVDVSDVPVIAKANAGVPKWQGNELIYTATPDDMAAHALRVRAAGVKIIGGCCGTNSTYLSLMRTTLDDPYDSPPKPGMQR